MAVHEVTAVVVAVLGLSCLSCGDGDGPTGTTASIQIAVNAATLSVPQGGSGTVTATLTRAGGFNGPVTLAISGLPAGVVATITPPQLTGTTTTATFNVTPGATVAVGITTAAITATAQGVNPATTTF